MNWESLSSYVYNGEDQSDSIKAYYRDIYGYKQYVMVKCEDKKTFKDAGQYTFTPTGQIDNYVLKFECL